MSGSGSAFALPLGASMKPAAELIRLPLRARPVSVLQGPGAPAPVLPPLYLEDAGLRVGKDPDPVSGPIRRRRRSAGFVSCVPSFDSSRFDGLHDLRDGNLARNGRLDQCRYALTRRRAVAASRAASATTGDRLGCPPPVPLDAARGARTILEKEHWCPRRPLRVCRPREPKRGGEQKRALMRNAFSSQGQPRTTDRKGIRQ